MTESARLAAWLPLKAAFDDLYESILLRIPSVRFNSGYHYNDTIPFWAYATYMHTSVAVDVCFNAERRGTHLLVSGDISLDGGPIINEWQYAELDADNYDELSVISYSTSFSFECKRQRDVIQSHLLVDG